MNARRALIALFAARIATTPLAALAQAGGTNVRRIGVLGFDPPSPLSRAWLGSFVAGMRDLGYVEGRDYNITRVDAGGQAERVAAAAAEVVAGGFDLILTGTTRLTLAAKNSTATIPIVMVYVSDPVVSGLVASMSQPGGNLTGIADFDTEPVGKRVELLREIVPNLSQLAVVHNPDYPTTGLDMAEVETAARRFKLRLVPIELRRALDIDAASEQVAKARPDGCIVIGAANMSPVQLYDSLARRRMPNVAIGTHARQGAMLSYGSDIHREFRQAASFVVRIFKGAKPGDLPIEQVTKLDLIVNLKAVRTIGSTIPQSMLLRADEVIE